MDFRRSGQLDERRRRVLRDELAQPAETESADAAPAGSGSAKGPVRAYAPAVLEERQLRVTDLVPVRPLWTAVVILLAVTAVATIECIHIHARTNELGRADLVAALDASQRGSLAAWFASLLLAGGAALALVVFGIRVHRVDDYRGRYRVWLWSAAALAWGSLDAATSLHDAVGLGLATLAGQASAGGSLAAAVAISWLALYGLVFGTLAIRLAIEIWPSLAAIAGLAAAGLLYLLAGLGVLDMLPERGPLVDSVVRTSLALLAHVSLVSSIALYARHVYLDATGRLKVHIDPDKKRGVKKPKARLKVVKPDKETADSPPAKPAAAADKSPAAAPPLKFGAASNQPKAGAAIARPASPMAASSADYEDEEEDEDESYGGERLSRAERRRLKKLARRDGQRRAA
jgi:MFS family permease